MKTYKRLLTVLVCSAALTGCGHAGKGMHDITEGISQMFSSGESGEAVAVNDTSALDMSTDEMAQYMSGGSVEVFGLDGTPAGDDGSYMPADHAGTPYSGDSSVVVYPMDGGATTSGGMPGVMPPSDAQGGYPSPFAGQGEFMPGPQSALSPARVYFDHNSSAVNEAGRQVIGHVVQGESGPLQVEGHASARASEKDPVARHMTNLKVSMDRALSVSRELMSKGVPAEMIKTSAFGDTRPALEGEAASRRVEIYSAANY